jgi:hypothetical protein
MRLLAQDRAVYGYQDLGSSLAATRMEVDLELYGEYVAMVAKAVIFAMHGTAPTFTANGLGSIELGIGVEPLAVSGATYSIFSPRLVAYKQIFAKYGGAGSTSFEVYDSSMDLVSMRPCKEFYILSQSTNLTLGGGVQIDYRVNYDVYKLTQSEYLSAFLD